MQSTLSDEHLYDIKSIRTTYWTVVCDTFLLAHSKNGHVIRALSWILGMSYCVIDGLVL